MSLAGKTLHLCSCNTTMPLDSEALARALELSGAPAINTRLCQKELAVFADHAAGDVVVACTQEAALFREAFHPQEISMQYRLPKFENPARQHGVTLGQAAERKVQVPELQQMTVVLRAQAYRKQLFAELDRVKDLLLL